MKKTFLAVAFVLPLLAGCSQAQVDDAISQGSDKLTNLAADAAAELLKATLVEEATARNTSPASVALLVDVAKSLPGVTLGYTDTDANDLVDMGTVTVTTLGKSACLRLPTPNFAGTVTPGACA